MSRSTRSSLARSATVLKSEPSSPVPRVHAAKRKTSSTRDDDTSSPPLLKRELTPTVKAERDGGPAAAKSPTSLQAKKLKLHVKSMAEEPFPTFARPTPAESALAHRILASLHGKRIRPAEVVASTDRAGCGDSPSVLDALVRTILSQNTSDVNSSRAKRSMDQVYGGSDHWAEIASGGQAKLQEAIKCGGLSAVKSKVIINILEQVRERYGSYSLDHLHAASTEDAMHELLSFDGVGPKTASCVLLFCLGREDFAVDTHVFRITGLLGWRPKTANREQTYHHLNRRIPHEDKYGLHILLVTHGKRCDECKAGGRKTGACELRKAFREGVKGDLAEAKQEQVKGEQVEEEQVKEEQVKEEQVKEEMH